MFPPPRMILFYSEKFHGNRRMGTNLHLARSYMFVASRPIYSRTIKATIHSMTIPSEVLLVERKGAIVC